MDKWRVVVDKYPAHSLIAGQNRYSVVDMLGNVAYITNVKDRAEGFCTACNSREI